jgi:hypothetical protein
MIKKYQREAKFAELKPYCFMSEEHDFMELTEWWNGEGFDVVINSKGEQRFSLTWGQWEALQVLVNYKE